MKTKKYFILNALIILSVIATVIASINWYYYFKYPLKYENIILNEASANQIDADFVCAVIAVESRFNKYALSSKGAIGLMQLMPDTALSMADELNIDLTNINDLYDENINIRLGTYYLRYLKNKFISASTMLAAYNAGEGNVSKWLLDEKYSPNGVSIVTTPFKETNEYIKKVLKALKIYRNKRLTES